MSWRILTNSTPVLRVVDIPFRMTPPADGFMRTPKHFSKVDFPEPDGPTMATASPFLIDTFNPLNATTFPSSAVDE